jgi:hypothetical protein
VTVRAFCSTRAIPCALHVLRARGARTIIYFGAGTAEALSDP